MIEMAVWEDDAGPVSDSIVPMGLTLLLATTAYAFLACGATAPDRTACPTLTGTQTFPAGQTVSTYAYFKTGKAGDTYATLLVYDHAVIPPCLTLK